MFLLMNSRLRAALLNEGGKIDEPPLKKPREVKNKAESAEAAGAESKADGEAAGSADGEGAAGAESNETKKKGGRPPKEASSAAVAARDALLKSLAG